MRIVSSNLISTARPLYPAYESWCRRNGYRPISRGLQRTWSVERVFFLPFRFEIAPSSRCLYKRYQAKRDKFSSPALVSGPHLYDISGLVYKSTGVNALLVLINQTRCPS
uniref:Uncharacterized protein n=1 Tax=Phlegmariurus squarrosus TaxID=73615 RepID=H9M894_PHLSQ|nr:hypothetical protein HusqMp122 [Phlegmariurus squarrosus]AEV55801.1 hypothetical protein HusqMp122 [Phlegmariurus squarrosus]